MNDADDNELGGRGHRHPDLRHDHACPGDLRRVGLAVAFDEKGLVGAAALERPTLIQPVQVCGQLSHDAYPKADVVGLEDEPGHDALNPAAYGQEDTPRANVLPCR